MKKRKKVNTGEGRCVNELYCGILSQCILAHHFTHIKYIMTLSIIPQQRWKNKETEKEREWESESNLSTPLACPGWTQNWGSLRTRRWLHWKVTRPKVPLWVAAGAGCLGGSRIWNQRTENLCRGETASATLLPNRCLPGGPGCGELTGGTPGIQNWLWHKAAHANQQAASPPAALLPAVRDSS